MTMPIQVGFNSIKNRDTPIGITGLVDWNIVTGAANGGAAIRDQAAVGLVFVDTDAGNTETQSASFRDDEFGYFTGMPLSTILRWFDHPGLGLGCPGGPNLFIVTSVNDVTFLEIGISDQVFPLDSANSLFVDNYQPGGSVPGYFSNFGSQGEFGTTFPTPNPVTGTFWTIQDLIFTPTNPPIGPDWPQPTIFFVKEAIDNAGYNMTAWQLCIGQVIWFLPDIVSLDVTSGPTAGGTTVIITGSSLFTSPFAPNSIQTFFDGILATFVDLTYNPTEHLLTVLTPAHVAGVVDVTVRCWYPDGGFEDVTLLSSYTYLGGADIEVTGSGGFEIGEDPLVPTPIILSADASGIYTLVKGKRNDTVYLDFATDDTIDVAIPDPFAKTAYFGG